jgi:ribosomal protein S18 acetylase RimI-like enzyme
VDINQAGAGKVYISNLRVEHEHRRRGIAAQLIDAAVNTARRQGFSAVSLEARPSDNGSRRRLSLQCIAGKDSGTSANHNAEVR